MHQMLSIPFIISKAQPSIPELFTEKIICPLKISSCPLLFHILNWKELTAVDNDKKRSNFPNYPNKINKLDQEMSSGKIRSTSKISLLGISGFNSIFV